MRAKKERPSKCITDFELMDYFLLHAPPSAHRVDYDPSEKPANLANSAVLKMLQEEENAKRNGPRSGEYSSSR